MDNDKLNKFELAAKKVKFVQELFQANPEIRQAEVIRSAIAQFGSGVSPSMITHVKQAVLRGDTEITKPRYLTKAEKAQRARKAKAPTRSRQDVLILPPPADIKTLIKELREIMRTMKITQLVIPIKGQVTIEKQEYLDI